MSIGQRALAEAPIAELGATPKPKSPPKRQMAALADQRLIPEPR